MTAPPTRAGFLGRASEERNAIPRGTWFLGDDGLVPLAEGDAAVVLVPSEHVLLLTVDLPLASHRRRMEALPFAIEDRIAEPIEAVHVVLGSTLGESRYLAGVVRHDVMRRWVNALDEAGLGQARLVPDALMLPVPGEGWVVDLSDGRAVVRSADGAGFAVPEALLRTAWNAAGKPPCVALGEPLPVEMIGEAIVTSVSSVLDLRQGPYAGRGDGFSLPGRRVALVAALGALALGAIAVADTLALRHIAAEREDETRALLAIAAPGRPISEDVTSAASEMLPGGSASPGRFLPLMSRAMAAITPTGAVVRSVSFDGRGLAVNIETSDPAALASARRALEGAAVTVREAGR